MPASNPWGFCIFRCNADLFLKGIAVFRFVVFSGFLFLLGAASPAWALSCIEPQLTQKAVDEAGAIFEGVVVADRRPDMRIRPGSEEAMHQNVTYSFQVTKAWKGVTEGETVPVSRNVYWGGSFYLGSIYLVFAEGRDENGLFLARLCGLTTALENAEAIKAGLPALLDPPVPAAAPQR